MAQKITENKAMTEFEPISAIVKTTQQLNTVKEYLDKLISIDPERTELSSRERVLTKQWDLLKANAVMFLNKTANFRYNGYAFKASYEVDKPKANFELFVENLRSALASDVGDDFDAMFDEVSIKEAYKYILTQYGIDEAVVDECWDAATPKVEKGQEFRVPKMTVYKYKVDGDNGGGEQETEQVPVKVPAKPQPKPTPTPAPKPTPVSTADTPVKPKFVGRQVAPTRK